MSIGCHVVEGFHLSKFMLYCEESSCLFAVIRVVPEFVYDMKSLAAFFFFIISLSCVLSADSYDTVDDEKASTDKRAGHPTWRQYARVRQIAHQGSMPALNTGLSSFWEGSRPRFVRFIRTRPYTGETELPY